MYNNKRRHKFEFHHLFVLFLSARAFLCLLQWMRNEGELAFCCCCKIFHPSIYFSSIFNVFVVVCRVFYFILFHSLHTHPCISRSRYNASPHYSMASMKQKQFNTLKQLIQISMMMTMMYIIHLFMIKMALVRLYFGFCFIFFSLCASFFLCISLIHQNFSNKP